MYTVYWFTGYIFDTFNEFRCFTQGRTHPVLLLLCSHPLTVQGAMCGCCDPATHRAEGRGHLRTGPPPPSFPFLGQNEFDAYSVATTCARRWRSVIYTRCSN